MKLNDQFTFEDSFEFKSPIEIKTLSATFSDALAVRGIDVSALVETQIEDFKTADALVDTVLDAGIETTEDAAAFLVAQGLDIEVVDDLQALDGAKLHGAATSDGKVLIDSALTGAEMRAVLAEEIAEAAYYNVFGAASQGDFGAEVVYRATGGTDDAIMASLSTEMHADTVTTEYGEVQASQADFTFDFLSELAAQPEILGVTTYPAGQSPSGQPDFEVFKDSTSFSRMEGSVTDVDYRDFSLDAINGKYDLNNDGKMDEYKIRAAYANVTDGQPKIKSITTAELVPTSQSNKVLVGNGEVSTTWVLRESTTHSTSAEFNWNLNLAVAVESEVGLFGTGGSVRVEASAGAGGNVINGREFTVGTETRDTYTIPQGTYDPGTLVSYGFHMVTGDVLVEEELQLLIDITNAADGADDTVALNTKAFQWVNDHYLGIVSTDFDVRDAPNGAEILDLA